MVLSLLRISVNLCICEWIFFVLQDHNNPFTYLPF
nr:MAG TPA: hypothetical protein [Caudoviricetes sp.]